MRLHGFEFFLGMAFFGFFSSAAEPVVSNLRVTQIPETVDLEIRYDLADADSTNLTVSVNISTNNGASWFEPADGHMTGAVGDRLVAPGSDRVIVWHGGNELPAKRFSSVKVKVMAGDNGESAWFKMDDNAPSRVLTDSSSSAFNATNVSQNTSNRAAAGLVGGALTFQSGEFAATKGPKAIAACSGDQCTIAFWGKRASTTVHCEWFNMRQVNVGETICYYNRDLGQMQWHWYTTNGLQVNATTAFPANTWTHWAFIRSGTNFYQYKNGALTVQTSGQPHTALDEIRLGGRGNAYDNTRTLDDLRIYDTALSANDISALYNNGAGSDKPLCAINNSFGVSSAVVYDLSVFCTVTFDPAGGTVSQASKVVAVDSEYGELPAPERTGYDFGGWQASTNGIAFFVDSASNVTIPGDHVLTATWFPKRYTVTFDAQGGAVSPSEKAVTYGTAFGELPVPAFAGHTFSGWWTAPGPTGQCVTAAAALTTPDNMTLFARYIQNPVVSARSPEADPAPFNEGASIEFSVTAGDGTDPDAGTRGMSNIVWFVDGLAVLETGTGVPDPVTSSYKLTAGTDTVQGAAYRDIVVTAAAFDMQGCRTDSSWTVRVLNVPASQTVSFAPLGTRVIGDDDFVPGASVSSGLQVVLTSSNEAVAKILEGRIQIVGGGVADITASHPGNYDFTAAAPVKQTLTVKARLAAEVASGIGTLSGAGLYLPGKSVELSARPVAGYTFLRWEDGTQNVSRHMVMPNANVTAKAWFGLTTNVPPPVIGDPGAQQAMVGVPFRLTLDIESESLPSVTLSGLPSGLSYSAATREITGVPTAPAANKIVTVSAKNVNATAAKRTFTMTVVPLPVWAQGTFNGDAGTEALGSGLATMSVTAKGEASGKISLRGTNFSFSAKSFTSREADGGFTLVTTAKVDKAVLPVSLTVKIPEITDATGVVPPTLSKAAGSAGADGWVTMYRNVWKDAGMILVLTNSFAGYYTAALPGGAEYGSGYLTFTVDKAGSVKTAGKLADGTAVSLSGTLILDESGQVGTVLYTSPSAYMGGGLFGVAVLQKAAAEAKPLVRALDGTPCVWENCNTKATQTYGAGFCRELQLDGGWYDTVGNLYGYYAGKSLSACVGPVPAVPEILVTSNRYDAAWWSPDGIGITAVTNASGVLTGLAAPKAGAPVNNPDGSYDYAMQTNTVGLSVGLTRATGIFKGAFRAWFDYATTHTSRTVAYEGVLTPERPDLSDGVAGRGFFLWEDKAVPPLPAKPYAFSWSYDFKILLSSLPR